jgi:hypothetical protein
MPDLCCSVKFMPKFGNTAMVGGGMMYGGIHMADEEESDSCSEFGEDGVQYRASAIWQDLAPEQSEREQQAAGRRASGAAMAATPYGGCC